MELIRLIDALSRTSSYPFPVQKVEVRQTHISVVFLAGAYAYKVKKPVDLGFLDFGSLEKRRHFCEEEVRLNRRLAPTVYLGVVPITSGADGVKVEGHDEVIEWAVKMERLPEEAALQKRLQRGQIGIETVKALAGKVASFHNQAARGEHISDFGRFDIVAGNARENFAQAEPQVGVTVSQSVFESLQCLTEAVLSRLRTVIDSRAERGVPRDTHGDLHLDHVYLFPERRPPDDLVIIDCIEFNERFRFADPVGDMAFLVMDLVFHGRRDLAREFADEYFLLSGDDEGRALLPFYMAYRAAVRGKVEGLELSEQEIPVMARTAVLAKAQAHWLLALGELAAPSDRPCLVLVSGLPGAGKSTLARGLAERAGFHLIRSDVIRKEMAGVSEAARTANRFGEGIYSAEWTERTYAKCLARAERLLFEGTRVVVDATFGQEGKRRIFLEAAARLAVPATLLLCQAAPEVVQHRLAGRVGDASDADWSVNQKLADRWEQPGPVATEHLRVVLTDGAPEETLEGCLAILRGLRLMD
jgi:uncharacterized protein